MYKIFFSILIFLSLCSCGGRNDREILNTLQQIHETKNPQAGINRLDSMTHLISTQSEYVQMRYELVKLRLHDRAYDMPKSDKPVKRVLDYFTKHGSPKELQEVYFVAGSVYRDLKDAPTAIDYFLKSEYVAEHLGCECDSNLLRCTASNLCYLYSLVLHYPSCLEYAQKEYQLSLALNKMVSTTIVHLAVAYSLNNQKEEAFKYFDIALERLLNEEKRSKDVLSKLLYKYVTDQQEEKADTCLQMLTESYKETHEAPSSRSLLSIGYYYQMKGETDSAIVYFNKVLDKNSDFMDMYSASKMLYETYKQNGNLKQIIQYADMFVSINDSLDLGKQQEQAATVNNWYKYLRDKEEESRIMAENEAYKSRIFWIVVCIVFVSLAVIILFYRHRNQELMKVASLNNRIQDISEEKMHIEKQLEQKDKALQGVKEKLQKTEESKKNIDQELAKITQDLRKNEALLNEKEKRNREIIDMLHKNLLETDAEEVIERFKVAAKGKLPLAIKDWNDLYSAVDDLFPTFKEQLCRHLDPLTEERKKICYLKMAGFNQSQMQTLAETSRTTIWRLLSQCEWIKGR